MSNFCHLHSHDEYSLLDGLGTSKNYLSRAKELGQKYFAVTNHGNIDGLIKLQNESENTGVAPLFGAELYIVEDIYVKEKGEKRKHITVLINSEEGWINLNKMLTVANLEGFYSRPRISPKLLLEHCEGLTILTACSSSFITESWGRRLFIALKRRRKENLFIEVMPHNFSEQIAINELAMEFSKEFSIPLVATNDCHYVNKGDEKSHEVLLAIQSKKKWKDQTRWRFSVDGLYLRSREEMAEAFRKQNCLPSNIVEEALDNTIIVAEQCGKFLIKKTEVSLPEVNCGYKNKTDEETIQLLCEKGFKTKVLSTRTGIRKEKIYRDRLKEELSVIIKQGFARYFLIVWELVDWCKKNDIMVGPGRGSAGGSLVCYLLDITSVDPIKHDLLFARFISPARIDLPDVDMDFEDIKRYRIWEHFKEVYGENNVAAVSTFSSMKGKGAVRDVSRVFDVPMVDVNAASSCIVVRSGGDFRSDFTITDAFETFEDGRKFKKKYPEVTEIAIKLEGLARSKGQHAAAICISKEDLRTGERGYLVNGNKGELVINWDKYDIEHVGLMKMDVLGLSALTILNEARKLVKKNHGVDIDYDKLALDDKKIYKEFSEGNNVGIFQFGSLGLRKICREIGIDDFQVLTHTNALFRPGTLRCVAGDSLVKCFNGRKIRIDEIDCGRPIVSSARPVSNKRKYIKNFVRTVKETGTKAVYKITDSDGNSLEATANHKFFVMKCRLSRPKRNAGDIVYDSPCWCELSELCIGDRVLVCQKHHTERQAAISLSMVDNSTKFSVVCDIKYAGRKKTYDICTENQEFPNYVVNNFVTHNSGMVTEYIARKHGEKSWEHKHEFLEKITGDTLGIILYQEQVMKFMYDLGGLGWKTADTVRKVMSKSQGVEQFMKFKKMFADGCVERKTLDRETAEKLWDELASFGSYGFNKCVSEDTNVLTSSGRRSAARRISIKQAYEEGIKKIFSFDSKSNKSKLVSVKRIYKTGRKKLFEIVCRSNRKRSIKTSSEHRFLTEAGWKRLKEINVGEKVLVKKAATLLYGKENPSFGKLVGNDFRVGCPNKFLGKKFSESHKAALKTSAKRRIIHGHLGHKHSEETKSIIRKKTLKQIKEGKFPQTNTLPHRTLVEEMKKEKLWKGFVNEFTIENKFSIDIANPNLKIAIEVHGDYWHANPKFYDKRNFIQGRNVGRDKAKANLLEKRGWTLLVFWQDDIINNLSGCIRDIKNTLSDFNKNPWEWVEVEGIYSAGHGETYDIEVDNQEHNYIANMFVVHNSHAVEYTLLAYWQMFCKIYYPAEFLCASLTYGSDEKKEELVEEAIRLGVEIRPPKIGISKAAEWIIKNGILYCPFLEIKGIGEKTAEKLINSVSDSDGVLSFGGKKISEKFNSVLEHIAAYEDRAVSAEESEEISKYFDFSFNRDPYKKYRNVISRISENVEFEKVGDIDFSSVDKSEKFYFGLMTQIKFGYRGKIDTLEKKLGISGSADNLGGVYGNFKDDSDFCMLVFSSDIYNRKKDLVEHSSGEFLIAKANRPSRTTSIQCRDAWLGDEIYSCQLEGLGLTLIKNRRFNSDNYNLEDCEECELRSQCKSPVLPSKGTKNIMIVGEAPGKDEDENGKGFCGRSGKYVWDTFSGYGLNRSMFHVTNVVKCFPSQSKTPNRKQIKTCGKWLDAEIKNVNPVLILAFGNTCMEYFKGEEKGIMEMCGKTEWSSKHNAWICYCIHPASVLYYRENEKLFGEGVENFIRCMGVLGMKIKG